MKKKIDNEFENMTEEELKQKYVTIDEELKITDRTIAEVKNKLLAGLNKEGPNEFTRELFSGTAIQPNRVNVISETIRALQDSKELVVRLLTEKKRKRLIESFAGEIKTIEITQGSMGKVMTVITK